MTFKDLKKRIISSSNQQQTHSFDKLHNKPFWIWDVEEHKLEDIRTKGECCFNHIIGLPTKEGLEKPIFDYQQLLYDALLSPDFCNPLNHDFKDKHLWIKKATGLGVTEFFLRFMAWLCLRNDDYRNSQMCIVTGPNIDIAIKLIKRMKGLFESKLGLTFVVLGSDFTYTNPDTIEAGQSASYTINVGLGGSVPIEGIDHIKYHIDRQ